MRTNSHSTDLAKLETVIMDTQTSPVFGLRGVRNRSQPQHDRPGAGGDTIVAFCHLPANSGGVSCPINSILIALSRAAVRDGMVMSLAGHQHEFLS